MAQQKRNEAAKKSGAGHVFAVIGKVIGTVFLTAFLAFLIFACLFAVYVKNDLSQQAEWAADSFSLDQTSVIYYENPETGKYEVLQTLYGGSNSTWVEYDDIPKNLIHACIAIEDKRFEKHQGVDWVTTLRACFKMFLGKSEAGGSTITQQLIKNLTGEKEVTVRRKLVEIYRALEFEKTHTKKDIMEWYLNIIPLGENCKGVQSASRVYFGKDVKDLSLAECASLIGITNNPSRYDPYISEANTRENKERQEVILTQMLKQGYINQEQHDEAVAEELVFTNSSRDNSDTSDDYYSWFEDQVIRDVVSDLCDKTGYEYDIVYKMVMTGGYQIYSTVNPEVQAAVDAVYEDLQSLPATASSQQLQSGIVIVDNTTGDVVALAGGVGRKQGSLVWNCATQSLLSPGSIIKPVAVYAPAIELGLITPATVMDDTPYSFTDSATWPKNLDSTYRGLVSVEEAVAQSINTVPVKLVAQMTPEYSYSFAKDKMGLSTLVSSYQSNTGEELSDVNLWALALGSLTRGVTVRSMTAAYASFANEGVWREARTYTVVKDANGQIILDNTQDSHVAMKDMTAWYITDMLETTVQTGTGTAAQLENMTVAGKTGTTSRDFDRWFAGYTPYYTSVVWCGYNDPEEIVLTDSETNPAIVMWKKVMEQVHQNLKNKAFKQPANLVEVTVCRDSGLLPSDACALDPRGERTVRVTLSAHDVPTETCNVHKEVEICNASGHVANEYCAQVPGNSTHKAALLDVSRAFPKNGVVVLDQAYAILSDTLPAGYYAAVSPDVDAINVECYIHSEDDLPELEPEEDEEDDGTADSDEDDAQGVIDRILNTWTNAGSNP
ncbi:MAG: transglycosylase domain-containing protein [Oscillospiraceae bacterium]